MMSQYCKYCSIASLCLAHVMINEDAFTCD